MAEKIEMPQLSDTMESGTIVKWFVEEGDAVERGDVLAEVETDKATMDLEAFDDGTLLKKLIEEGEDAPTQSIIAVIGEEGEDISGLLAESTEDESNEETATKAEDNGEDTEDVEGDSSVEEKDETQIDDESSDSSVAGQKEQQEPSSTQETSNQGTGTEPAATDGRLRASPVARRMAAKNGIELGSIEGSGPEGRIIKKDVKKVLEGETDMASVSSASVTIDSSLEDQKQDLSGMRKTIAERMSEAKRSVPHFYLEQDINVDQVLSLVESLKAEGQEVSLNDFILMAAARSMNEVPRMNSSYREDHVKLFGQVDLGFAVAVEDGLFTPIIDEAETKSIQEIHNRSLELIEKARNGTIKPEEYNGGTFTVSNLGMFDIPNFSAVINPPEAGILAVGKAEERPVAEDGNIEVQNRMSVTLSCDHRAVDGAIGARYLKAFKKRLESPARLYT